MPTSPGYWFVRFKGSENSYSWQKKIAYIESVDSKTIVRLISTPEFAFRIEDFDWVEKLPTSGVKGYKEEEKSLSF